MPVLAPMPSARVNTAVAVKAGDWNNWRSANFASAQMLSRRGHCQNFAASLFDECCVAEGAPGFVFGFAAAESLVPHELFGLFFEMLAQFFVKIVVKAAAAEDVG
jgi:hypothetical protein